MDIVNIITIVIALATCFFGYKLNKILIAIFGLIIGFNLGVTYLPNLLTDQTVIYIVSAIIAIAVGIISYNLYLVGVFLLCALAAFILCGNLNLEENIQMIISIIAGLIAGILGVKFTRPIMIISTSLAGASALSENALTLFNFQNNTLEIILFIVVAILGIVYQFTQKEVD